MEFTELKTDDWPLFLAWAAAENWRVPERERHLIGNLLVAPKNRGRGYGAALFDFALEFLQRLTLKRIWLTASQAGMPIYQRRGFSSVDRIERWQGAGLGRAELQRRELLAELIETDRSCWGELRAPLLNALGDGEICRSGETLGLLQPGTDGWQLGPWLSPKNSPRENHLLLTEALGKTPVGRPLVIDTLVSADLGQLLRSAGMVMTGSNELMCLSRLPVTTLNGVAALASLGSIG